MERSDISVDKEGKLRSSSGYQIKGIKEKDGTLMYVCKPFK